MAVYNVYKPNEVGSVVVPVAVSASDTFAVQPTGKYVLVVINAGGSPDNVVIDDPVTPLPAGAAASGTFADIAQAVANGTTKAFQIEAARHAAGGVVTVTNSFITTVTAYVLGPFAG
jgi:hypothetical protein